MLHVARHNVRYKFRLSELTDSIRFKVGIDCIWHNMFADSTFTTFRYQPAHLSVDDMIVKIGGHVQGGLYTIVSLSASKHQLTVVCVCERDWNTLPDGWFC